MRKPTLSPSRITTYLACPVKYRWTYVDSRGRWYVRAKSTYSFGTTLHRVLERFHDSGDVGVETVSEAMAAVEENWLDAGYSSATEMAEALGDGKAVIERYVDEFKALPRVGKTVYVEKNLKLDFTRFRLVGRVDRVDEHEDGTLEIVDYKTGRDDVSEDDVATDIAMCCYQLLIHEEFPDRPVKATLWALRTNVRASYAMSPDELAEFKRDIERIGDEILTEDYDELVPKRKGLCRTCDFVPLCKRHPDYEPG